MRRRWRVGSTSRLMEVISTRRASRKSGSIWELVVPTPESALRGPAVAGKTCVRKGVRLGNGEFFLSVAAATATVVVLWQRTSLSLKPRYRNPITSARRKSLLLSID